MTMRVLVTAASRHGATDEIAAAIGAALTQRGLSVTVLPPEQVRTLDPFDAVILGSGVYVGRWLEPARAFAASHRGGLADRPVWLFSSGPIGDPPKPDEDPTDIGMILASTGARGHRVFPGRLDRRRLGFGEKLVASAVRAPEGDYRPWPEIDAWADAIAGELLASEATGAPA